MIVPVPITEPVFRDKKESIISSQRWIMFFQALSQLNHISQLLPIYTNNTNAKAGGLVPGDLYRLGGDPDYVCIVY